MGLDKLIKREIGITIAVVLLVTTVFIMFSYSIFKVEKSGEQNVISFGDISMSMCTDSSCNSTISNLGNIIGTKPVEGGTGTQYVPVYPQKDPTEAEWNELTPYTFTLTNDGDLDLYISIYLTRAETPELEYTVDGITYTGAVPDDQIKVAIGERGATPTIKLFSELENKDGIAGAVDKKIAGNILLPKGQTKIFNLYAYLKEDAENASQGKIFVTQISARGEYLPSETTPAS